MTSVFHKYTTFLGSINFSVYGAVCFSNAFIVFRSVQTNTRCKQKQKEKQKKNKNKKKRKRGGDTKQNQ